MDTENDSQLIQSNETAVEIVVCKDNPLSDMSMERTVDSCDTTKENMEIASVSSTSPYSESTYENQNMQVPHQFTLENSIATVDGVHIDAEPDVTEKKESLNVTSTTVQPNANKETSYHESYKLNDTVTKRIAGDSSKTSKDSSCSVDKANSDSVDVDELSSQHLASDSDDVQLSLDKGLNTLSEGNTTNLTGEDTPEKNIHEPENTEFVQFLQEKHGDAQMETQSVDAEDPFAGDNLNAENIEQMETDNLADGDMGFSKLCEQADILQGIANTTDGDFAGGSNDSNKTSSPKENNSCKVISHKDSKSSQDKANISDGRKNLTEKGVILEDVSSSTSRCTEQQTSDTTEGNAQMEADEEQSNVLPGQDDELCIIPDSMKMIVPEKTDKNVNRRENDKSPMKELVLQQQKTQLHSDTTVEALNENLRKSSTVVDNTFMNEQSTESTKEEETSVKKDVSPTTTDVINLDDDAKNSEVEEITTKETCKQCKEERSCKIKVKVGLDSFNICSKTCKALFSEANNKAMDIPSDGVNSKHEKRCANCLLIIEVNDERNLSWETMEFCNEECLGKFQTKYGSYCRNCNGSVQAVSLGKYCVRFGYDVRQFCCSTCLEEFKKGLKVCTYCQKDISSGTEGFLAPVGEKGQFKDFCTQDCMEKYSRMSSIEHAKMEKKCCGVCQEEKIVHCEVQIDKTSPVAICSDPCFAAFKFVNKVDPEQCSTCKTFFQLPNKKGFVVFYENEAHTFCSKTCLNIFIITNRKIVACNWCKVKKYNFDMIRKELKTGQSMMMCSLNCLTLYQVSINAVSAKRINCDFCKEFSQAQYHLTMSDATIRNFCSYNCVMNFQGQYTKSPITIPSGDDPVPTGMPKRSLPQRSAAAQSGQSVQSTKVNEVQNKKNMPVISSVTSLAAIGNGQASPTSQAQNNLNTVVVSSGASNALHHNQMTQVIYKQQVITRPPSPPKIHNKLTQCKPLTHTKGVSVRPHPCTKSTQTEELEQMVVPIPVPIYVPYPVHMFSFPFPVPLPFPLPIPVPLFIPTTRNSAKGIFKDIRRIQEKIPADPFEAELLMMAEMVATEKKGNESDSDSPDERDDDGGEQGGNAHSDAFSPDGVDSSNTFGDMLQMALKMATGELDEPAVDLEAALTPNTITATQAPAQAESSLDNDPQSERLIGGRGRKRMVPYKARSTPNKRGKRISATGDIPLMPPPETQPPPPQVTRIVEPMEKPDANMALKYTFGVNAWRQWVVTKNAELEKQSMPARRMKFFKTDLLQLTADELNYSLCLFVKEVRKPNGSEYAPDTIYYLCLGIQQYLFENNRIDNIFTDAYYEKFTDCLNEVAKKFSLLYNDAQYIVTRVEEDHLWECKQLGAHSPHVLLSTLMFFNTKHFNLVTVEEHMQLSFSHIMKHWKRNPAAQPAAVTSKIPGSRNVLLRFYPPQSALEANSRKKKVYEQQENEENPLRCPVKLYEFYLSKCPESVKTRNDVFYLLPERSCVPDSPVWYSTSPLAKEQLVKMLYRIKMVKEINVALLTS